MLKKIEEVYGSRVKITYKMGGLLESWTTFYDELNDIDKPEQVAPHWQDVSKRSGMPIDERIWLEDPPSSTYPAGIAYKSAQMQYKELAKQYLRRLREAVLTERKNIAREEVLIELAKEVGLDAKQFAADLKSDTAREAFHRDREEAISKGITGFPTLSFRSSEKEILVVGYRPFSDYAHVINDLTKGKVKKRKPKSIQKFVERHFHVATREVAEVFELSMEETQNKLEDLELKGRIRKLKVANGYFWEPAE